MIAFPNQSSEKRDARSDGYSVIDYIREFISRDNFKTTAILLYSVLALTAWKYVPSAGRFADPATGECVLGAAFDASNAVRPLDGTLSSKTTASLFLWDARKIWSAFVLMGILPSLIVAFVFKEKLSDYGLTVGLLRRTVANFFLFLPVMLVLGWSSGNTREFYGVYPYNPLAGVSWGLLVVHSLTYLFLYYLSWEFMFRGFIQLGLTQTVGVVPAVLTQVLASTMLHYGHPASETFGCVAGGFLWGFLVYRTKSIFSGWGQHAALGIALDWSLILKAL